MGGPSILTARASATLALLGLVAGCGSPEITFTLVFPSQDTFLVSSTAEITVYAAGEDVDPDTICRNLSIGQASGAGEPLTSSGAVDVCDLPDGGIALEGVDVGRLVLFAEVKQAAGVVLMRGCRVADVYATGVENVAITLATLPTYPENAEVLCANVDEKCVDGKQCLGS